MKMSKKEIEQLAISCKELGISNEFENSIFADSSFDQRKNIIDSGGKYKNFENGKIVRGELAYLHGYHMLFLETYLTGEDDYDVDKVCDNLCLEKRKIKRELHRVGSAFGFAFTRAEELMIKGMDFSKSKKIIEIENRKKKLLDKASDWANDTKAFTEIHKLILEHDKLLANMIDGHMAVRQANVKSETIKITAKIDLTTPIDDFQNGNID